MSVASKSAVTIILMLIAITLWSWRRQKAIDIATTTWQLSGGGILDTEFPLVGPAEVFLDFGEFRTENEIQAINDAAKLLQSTCSPSFQFRWKDRNGKLNIARDEQLSMLEEILDETGVKEVVLLRASFSVNRMVEMLQKVDSIQRFIVPKNCFTENELDEVNKLLGRNIVQCRSRQGVN